MVDKTNKFKMSKYYVELIQIKQLLAKKPNEGHPIFHKHSQHTQTENHRIWKR